jgi:putative ABC transport system permease protein
MDTLLQDLRYAFRSLRRSPAFTLAAILTLALGIGANAAIFNIIDAVLLRPLPYPSADRLAVIWGTNANGQRSLISPADIIDWRTRTHSFDDISMLRQQSVNLTGGETPERLSGAFISANTLSILGAHVARGRLMRPEETEPGASAAVAVLSYSTWTSRFGSDTGIVGRTLTLNGNPHIVIGVTSADFVDPYGATEIWLPVSSANPAWLTRGVFRVWALARLKPGVTLAQARRDLSGVMTQLATELPATNAGQGASITPLRESIVGATGPVLLIVLGFVGVVLLIACANVANLQLARASARRREFSVRAALGAGRARLVRQLLTENVLLAITGGGLGLTVSVWATQALVAMMPGGLPAFGVVSADMRVALFCGVITIGSGFLFGTIPAFSAARTNLSSALSSRTGGVERGRSRFDPRDIFVAAQLALCVVLLIGAGLLGRSLVALQRVNPGFALDGLLTAQFRLPPTKYRTPEEIQQFMARTIDEVRATPGVKAAALVQSMPLTGNFGTTSYTANGTAVTAGTVPPMSQQNAVGPGYFATMGIPLTAGRDFETNDRPASQPVVIINEAFAAREWPGQSALGRTVRVIGPPDALATVVGVVGNIAQLNLGDAPGPQLYQPFTQAGGIFASLAVRANGDPAALVSAVRKAVWRIDPDQPVWSVRPMTAYLDQNVATPRFTLTMTAAFALLALLLAVVGVYGVMAYILAQRTREVGIRMALGARRSQVVALVMGRGVRTVAIATIVGIAGAFGAAHLLQGQLFEVKANDPLTFVVVPVVLATVALVACYLPARRAARVDPVVALRQE